VFTENVALGPYEFLDDKFLSSAPGAGSGGVRITFYESKQSSPQPRTVG